MEGMNPPDCYLMAMDGGREREGEAMGEARGKGIKKAKKGGRKRRKEAVRRTTAKEGNQNKEGRMDERV